MAKTKISEFSATPGNNTDIDGINIAEGCAPSGINDAIRELMAQLKDFQTGAAGDSFNGPVGTTTAAAGAFTTLSASGTVSGTGFSNYLASPPAIGGTTAAAGSFTTLTTSGAVTHNAGTANGVAYLNGSKVLTSGSALTFDGSKLGVGTASPDRTLTVRNGGPAVEIDPAGIGGANPIYFNYNRTTSTYLTPQHWALAHIWNVDGGSEQMRLTSTGLGIGTSSPSAKLQSNVSRTSGQNVTALVLSDTVTGAQTSGFGTQIQGWSNNGSAQSAIGFEAYGGTNNDTALGFYTQTSAGGLTRRMTISSAGDVGIGTSSPTTRLSVVTASTNAGISVNDGTVNTIIYNSTGGVSSIGTTTNHPVDFYANNAARMRIDSSGNVGIGTSSPSARLEVADTTSAAATALVQFTGQNGYEMNLQSLTTTNSTVGARYNFAVNSSSGEFSWSNSGGERARIDSSGNLLVGATSTVSSSVPGVRIFMNGPNGGAINIANNQTGGFVGVMSFINGNGTVGQINTSGSSTSYVTSSDYRLKHDIQPMTGALAKVQQLKPVTYKWNADDSSGEGFIAHELQAVCPSAVTGEKDAVDAEGNPQYQGIDTSFLVATLTAALQEAHGLIKDLQVRVNALEAK